MDESNALTPDDLSRFDSLPESCDTPTGGVPLGYSRARAAHVLSLLEDGTPTDKIEDITHSKMPSWILWGEYVPAFGEAYVRARKIRAARHADAVTAIPGTVDPDSPFGNARVGKARLQVESHKWAASVMDPERYGDRTHIDLRSESVSLIAFLGLTASPATDGEDPSPPPGLAPDVPT